MIKLQHTLTVLALAATACSPPASDTTTPPAASTVPAEIAAAVSAAMPGITITGGELDDRGNQYEVTGTMPNGDQLEFDLERSNGAWTVSEIQRDVPWSAVPEPVRAAAGAAPNPFEPVRVIESRQPADGAVIYELFAPPAQGARPGGGPALEVRWHEGKAAVVPPVR